MEGGGGGNKEESQSQSLPPGFRFHPSDEELITYYLINKISDPSFTGRAIADVDLNKNEPWELPGKAKMGEKEWYFFSLRDRKYPTGVRTNRATNTGYWKTTGKDKEIVMTSNSSSVTTSSSSSEVVGMKKTLVFYKGRAPRGEKSNWVMHEYRIHSKSSFRSIGTKQDEWVVCRVFQKSGALKKYPPNSNHTRGLVIHPYGLDIAGFGGINVMPHPNPHAPPLNTNMNMNMNMMQLGVGDVNAAPHFLYGRNNNNNNYIPMLGTSDRGSTATLNLPLMQSHFNFPVTAGGGFTISGLNLNLGGEGGGGGSSVSQPYPRTITQNDVVTCNMVTAATNSLGEEYGTEMSNLNLNPQTHSHSNRYMGMDHCVDLDTYWPSY